MTASAFENRLAEAARAGRAKAEEMAADSDYTKAQVLNLEPDDDGMDDTNILLSITGFKTLHDEEEAEAIIGVYRDNFYDKCTEIAEEMS